MLKIRRCHLSCVGNRNARFSPVNLNFTTGESAGNSLVFLENGGGKTTLAAFLYLTLWPEQNHFLLKKAKDSQARVANYLLAGQTAYSVLECETRVAGLLDDSVVRVIGQVLKRRDASERSPIDRHFFTFLPRPGLTFEELPIHGINGQAASHSFDDFRRWLREQQGRFPAAELWESSSVDEFVKKLREVHAEPDLVRVQVDLNKREGGIKDHFKEHCADSRKFVHTLLDLSLQSTKGEETAAVLGKFLSEWQNIGHLEDETDFCDQFASALATLGGSQERWDATDAKLRSWRQQASGFWRSLNDKVGKLNRERTATVESLREIKEQAADAKRDVENTNHHVISYELEWLELRASEAAKSADDADQQWREARRRKHLGALSIQLGEIERRRRDLEAKRQVLKEKQAELAPLLDKLNALGAAFASRLETAITSSEQESATATTSLRGQQARVKTLEKNQQTLAVERSQHERTITDAKAFFERRRYQRDQLAEKGCLEANERAEDGRERWKSQKQAEEANVTEQRQRQQQLSGRLKELNDQRIRAESEATKAESEAGQLQATIEDARRQRAAIAGHDLILAHFGEDFDPMRHGAEDAIGKKQVDVFHALLNHQLDLAAAERNREGITRYQVLPPPRDVETVLQRLTEAGIGAIAGLRYLAETCGCDEAAANIRSDPARYAGILIEPKDWERLATLAWPEVSQPVKLTPRPEKFAVESAPACHVIVPTKAAFEKAEATRLSLRLEEETSNAKRLRDARQAEYDGLGKVLSLLRAFIERFGDGKLSALERELQAKQRHVEALKTRSAALKQEIEETSAAQQTARVAELASLNNVQEGIQPKLNALDRFITEYEEKVESTRTGQQAAENRLQTIEQEETALKSNREACEQEIEKWQQQVFQIGERLRLLREEHTGIHYRQAEVDAELARQTVETIRASYQQQRQLYEGQQDSQAQVEIRTAEQLLESKQGEFSKQLKDATEEEVRAIAAPLEFSEPKLREHSETTAREADEALQLRAERNAERDSAKREWDNEERTAPEDAKRRFPEGEKRPGTSAEALNLLEQGRVLLASCHKRKQDLDEQARSSGERARELEKQASEYEAQRNLLDGFKELEAAPVDLPKEFAELKSAIVAIREGEKAAFNDEQRDRRERDDKLKLARDVVKDERFAEKKLSFVKKFELYTDDALLADLGQIRADLEQRIASNRDRVAGLKQTREQLVQMMDGLADEVLALLRSIEKVSRLPEEGMGVWSGKPFIRISYHHPEESERQVGLRALLSELVEWRRAPSDRSPDTDAAGLIRLIADRLVCDKRIHVQILKPTPIRTDTYEDVELLRHYSGGEGVTVAILMYLTIVQLRAQNLQSSRRLQDAGFLLLDNPFGECNREDLVRMQVQLAEQLRVQLIVLTGLREPVIMMSYPRRVRLVNNLLNRVTGAKHVRVVDDDANITTVENLRRFDVNDS
jgi:hypothetical protein